MIIKIKNVDGLKKFIQIILIFIVLIICPININSAELLQIKDVNTIVVGDQNRSLYLSLYCVDINQNEKENAIKILKRNFPRGTKVKIKIIGRIFFHPSKFLIFTIIKFLKLLSIIFM